MELDERSGLLSLSLLLPPPPSPSGNWQTRLVYRGLGNRQGRKEGGLFTARRIAENFSSLFPPFTTVQYVPGSPKEMPYPYQSGTSKQKKQEGKGREALQVPAQQQPPTLPFHPPNFSFLFFRFHLLVVHRRGLDPGRQLLRVVAELFELLVGHLAVGARRENLTCFSLLFNSPSVRPSVGHGLLESVRSRPSLSSSFFPSFTSCSSSLLPIPLSTRWERARRFKVGSGLKGGRKAATRCDVMR